MARDRAEGRAPRRPHARRRRRRQARDLRDHAAPRRGGPRAPLPLDGAARADRDVRPDPRLLPRPARRRGRGRGARRAEAAARHQHGGGRMIRRAFTMRLKSGGLAGYKENHDNIWQELVDEIERSGIAQITIFENDPVLVLYSEIRDPDAWDRLWAT